MKQSPKQLKGPGRAFWKKAMGERVYTEIQDLSRLEMAAGCCDEIAASEQIISEDGLFIKDRFFQVREHPALKVIRDNKTLFCRIIRELRLDVEATEDSRPPGLY